MDNDSDNDDSNYDDLRNEKASGRKPLTLIILILLVVILAGAGTYAYLNDLIPIPGLGQGEPQPEGEGEPTLTADEPLATEVGAVSTTQLEEVNTPEPAPEATATTPATETSEPEAQPAARLYPPEFGHVVFSRNSADGDWEDKAVRLAGNMAIAEPFDWEYLEYDDTTRLADVRSYYINLLFKEMGYRLAFDQSFEGGISVLKFKQDGRRVTIQFWEGQLKQVPYALVFYEGW
jgi:hypothetical protein